MLQMLGEGMVHRKGKKSKRVSRPRAHVPIRAIDLFCGIGGLTRGLEQAGIDVSVGVDIDPACEYAYTANNRARFLLRSVADLKASDLSSADGSVKLLAGCAPCQPFSTYHWKSDSSDDR